MAKKEEGKLVTAVRLLIATAEASGWVKHAHHPLFLKRGTDGKTYGLRFNKQSLTIEVKRPTTDEERQGLRRSQVWEKIDTKGILTLVKGGKVTGLNLPDPVK